MLSEQDLLARSGDLTNATLLARPERAGEVKSIVLASTSRVRLDFLRNSLPDSQIQALSGGQEAADEDEVGIATHKVDFALNSLPQDQLDKPLMVIGADARKRIMTANGLREKGKPENEDEIRQTFSDLQEGSLATGKLPFFVISAGSSAALVRDGNLERIQDRVSVLIELRQSRLNDLMTDDGYQRYIAAFNSTHFPRIDSQDLPSDIMLSTGGLDLVTLLRIGVVESIDGVPAANTPRFREVVQKALYTSYASFSEGVLQIAGLSQDEIRQKVQDWPWLNELAGQIFEPKLKPKLSIVVPVYNDKSIGDLLASLEQCERFEESEIVIVRNGQPSEDIIEITEQFAIEHANVKVIHSKKLGIAPSRNAGFADSTADLIANLDSDVVVNPNFITAVLNVASAYPDAEILTPSLYRQKGNGILQGLTSLHFAFLNHSLGRPLHNPGLVLKKSAFGDVPFNERLKFGEDSEFSLRTNGRNPVQRVSDATVTHQADANSKLIRQYIAYGRDKSTISRIHPDLRKSILKQKLVDTFFIPRYKRYRELGHIMAAYEGIIGILFSLGFWAQEIRYLFGKDSITSQIRD